jgi:hypothetical protein
VSDVSVSDAALAVLCAIRGARPALPDAIACANATRLPLDVVRGALDELWAVRAIDYDTDPAGGRTLALRAPVGHELAVRCP